MSYAACVGTAGQSPAELWGTGGLGGTLRYLGGRETGRGVGVPWGLGGIWRNRGDFKGLENSD